MAYYKTYNNRLTDRAVQMRRDMTPAERRLWFGFLRSHKCKFYRQRVIENYIVDFYCPSGKLIIELDGQHHFTKDGLEYDEIRTELLEAQGLRVIRFENKKTETDFKAVCEELDNALKAQIPPQPAGCLP